MGTNLSVAGRLSGIMSKTTGPPIIVATGIDQALTGQAGNQRPNITPGFTVGSMQVGDREPMVQPARLHPAADRYRGQRGKRHPARTWSIQHGRALLKDTKIPKISEQFAVQFKAEFFNIPQSREFRDSQLEPVHQFVGSAQPAAGQITSSNPGTIPRQIQFALKIIF